MADNNDGKDTTDNKNRWTFDDLPERGLGVALKPLLQKLEPLRAKMRGLSIAFGATLVLLLAYQSCFQLEPEEEAVVLRFGKPVPEIFGPGLHFRIPVVDQIYKVPVNRQQRLEFGFRSNQDSGPSQEEQNTTESLMLTGDLMLAHVRWSLVYKVEDIHTWLFKVKGHESTIRDISMAVMRQIVGDYSLDEVLTSKQLEVASLAHEATQAALRDKVPTGVLITEVAIKDAMVPVAAREAFDDLTRTLAKVQGELAVAKADQDEAIGVARNTKNEYIGAAEKVRDQVIENARGEAAAFLVKSKEYVQAPEITRQWMYLKTMKTVLAALDEKLVIEDSEGGSVAKHLPLKDFFTVGAGGAK